MRKLYVLILLLFSVAFCTEVSAAGTISWKESERIDSTHFAFYIDAIDLNINYLSAQFEVGNGEVTRIYPLNGWNWLQSGWKNIFVHDGTVSGNSRIARVVVEMSGNVGYSLHDVLVKNYQCDGDGNFSFGPTGSLVDTNTFIKQCYSNDATLSNLTVSHGTLNPTFQKNVKQYSLTVDYNVSTITFNPTVSDSNARVKSGTSCSLKEGENTCNIVVVAANLDELTYTIQVTRKSAPVVTPPKSNDATLSNLTVSHGTLNPNFQKNITQYSLTVDNSISTITFSPTLSNNEAKIVSGTTCSLNEAVNNCNIIITAEDGTTNTYMIQVTRKKAVEPDKPSLSSDATIASLKTLEGVLSPQFDPNILSYTITLNRKIDSFEITYFVNYERDNPSYQGHHYLCLIDDNMKCDIVVTAEDGTTTKIYQFAIQVLIDKDPSDVGNDSIGSEDGNKGDSDMNDGTQSSGEIDNPQTGDILKPGLLLLSFLGIGFALIFLKKKNSIQKL